MTEKEVLLRVEGLEQFFKLGRGKNKAVNDIDFEVYKGEVFGIVGESGCGKTTTGRSIIRLYDITGGSVYFHGQRICAGIRQYREKIALARKQFNAEIAAAKAEMKTRAAEIGAEAAKTEFEQKRTEANDRLTAVVSAQLEEIKSAKYDHKNCNKIYGQKQADAIFEEYAPLIEQAKGQEERQKLTEQRDAKMAFAKKDRIMNKMQMIFQDPSASLNPRMTVREIIAEGLIVRGVKDKATIDEAVYNTLDLVGLVPEHANRYPHEFSGGQRQRIGIARSIVLNPDLIIADEPISALDVSIQAQVINLLNDLRERLGLTIIFIAHDLSVVKYFSDRIAVMYYGKIVELADSDELFDHPLHPYTRSLLSAIPVPDPHSEKTRQRVTYNRLAAHDYSVSQPTMQEVKAGHYIYCNDEELVKYKQMIADIDAKKAAKNSKKPAEKAEKVEEKAEKPQAEPKKPSTTKKPAKK